MWLIWQSSQFRDFWIKIIVGSFGTWKTKNTFQDAYLWKKENPDWILIANVPYDFVDLQFSHKDDLNKVFAFLKRYIQETNNDVTFRMWYFPPIRLIVDEAHLYYFSRDFKALDKEILLIMTQCRKRRIAVDFVTQELAQLDIFIRRLCPFVVNYSTLPFWFRVESLYYMKTAESTELWEDNVNTELVSSQYMRNNRRSLLFKPSLKDYFNQKHLTYYIIGADHLLDEFTYEDFEAWVKELIAPFLENHKKKYELPRQKWEDDNIEPINTREDETDKWTEREIPTSWEQKEIEKL